MAGRRGNNEGGISKRSDGRWMARITLDGGKRKAIYGKTRAEVATKLREALHDVGRGVPLVDERQILHRDVA